MFASTVLYTFELAVTEGLVMQPSAEMGAIPDMTNDQATDMSSAKEVS
jgi:hypothetical protein